MAKFTGQAGPGRPAGRKNKVPGSVKASVREVLAEVAEKDRAEIREAIRRGIRSRPPHSLRYVELVAHYTDGKPKDSVEISDPNGEPMSYRFLVVRASDVKDADNP